MAQSEAEFVEWLSRRAVALEFIRGSVRGGLSDYDNPTYYHPDIKRDHTKSTAAMCRNCHIVAHARRAAMEIEGISIVPRVKGLRVTFLIDGLVEVWYKAISKHGEASMRWSRQNTDYKMQVQEPIPGLEDSAAATAETPSTTQTVLDLQMPPTVTRVFAGHKPLPATGGMKFEIVVVCPPESGSSWEVRLSEGEVSELVNAPLEVQEELQKRVHKRKGA